ncbi:APC family permease [Methylobacter tundripaludum]|nr:amino acid permease [Methylobacter tundripaludum]
MAEEAGIQKKAVNQLKWKGKRANGLKDARLGLFSSTALVVASMAGTGVFTTSGFLLAELKSPWLVLLIWLFGGALAICGALCYGALARRIPESGGEYVYLSRTLHPALGNIAGWVSLLVGFSAPLAAAAFGFGEYAHDWFPHWSAQWLGTILLCGFALIHAIDVGEGAWVQNFAVVFKLILIFAFIILAIPRIPYFSTMNEVAPDSTWGDFLVSLMWVSFSYSGWNAAVYVADEVREPAQNLPMAMVIGTTLITVLYILLNMTFVFAAPLAELAGRPDIGRAAAFALGGMAWANCLTILVALALATSISAMMMTGPRVYARMAEDGFLPRLFARHHSAPRWSIGLQCALALVLLWSSSFKSLLTYIGFTLNLSTAATVIGLMRLRWYEGSGFPVVGWPLVPVVFLLGVLAMVVSAIQRQPMVSLYGIATLAFGWLAWRVSRPQTK